MAKKKIKLSDSEKDWQDFKKQKNIKPLPFKIAYPLGKTKNKPIQIKFGDVWLDARNVTKALDVIHKEIAPGEAGAAHVFKKLSDSYINKKINWFTIIIAAESVGITPAKLFKILAKYFREKDTSKLKVAMINPLAVEQLVKKINKWGGAPKLFKKHKDYMNSWCSRNGIPLFATPKDLQNWVTNWKRVSGIGTRPISKPILNILGGKLVGALTPQDIDDILKRYKGMVKGRQLEALENLKRKLIKKGKVGKR